MLTTEGADEIELFELRTVPVDKLGPLVHFVPRLFVELVLEIIVLLLQFLRQLVDDIVLELQQLALLFVVVHEHTSLGQLPR